MPRARKRCGHGGCDEFMPCPEHRPVDRRPPARQRGYDAHFEWLKQNDPAYLAATHCPTCGDAFTATGPRKKTAGHRREIRKGGTSADGIFAQCEKCNYGWRRKSA